MRICWEGSRFLFVCTSSQGIEIWKYILEDIRSLKESRSSHIHISDLHRPIEFDNVWGQSRRKQVFKESSNYATCGTVPFFWWAFPPRKCLQPNRAHSPLLWAILFSHVLNTFKRKSAFMGASSNSIIIRHGTPKWSVQEGQLRILGFEDIECGNTNIECGEEAFKKWETRKVTYVHILPTIEFENMLGPI